MSESLPMKTFEIKPSTSERASRQTVSQRRLKWADSMVFCLVFSLVVGIFYTIVVMGTHVLNPRDIGWLAPDPMGYYVGWELFRPILSGIGPSHTRPISAIRSARRGR